MADPKGFTRTSISLPDELLTRGQKNAQKKLRTFSNYIADLIARDQAELAGKGGGRQPHSEMATAGAK
jgi:hypothetical protein